MTRKEQKMAKALHQISALELTISQLNNMLGDEGDDIRFNLANARFNLKNVTDELYKTISATGLHQALYH